MWMEAIHQSEDNEEKCPTCGGGVRRRIYGEMYAGSFVFNGERVEIRKTPDPDFVNPIVLDPITQYFQGSLYRMWPSERYLSKGGARLHRDVWKSAYGPIPKGCHIHHRDGDVINNQLENLECNNPKEHLSENWKLHKRNQTVHFTSYARERAAEWHQSEEGRAWHKQNAIRTKNWTKWKREERDCPECGIKFQALIRKSGNAQIYCSSACKSAAYRKRGKSKEYAAAYRARQADKRNS